MLASFWPNKSARWKGNQHQIFFDVIHFGHLWSTSKDFYCCQWKLLSTHKKNVVNKSECSTAWWKRRVIHLAMYFKEKRWNHKSLGDSLCFSNCVREVCLAPIKWETPRMCGRVDIYVSIKSLRDFLVHDSAKAAKSVWPSFLLSSAAAYNSVARWMLFFTITSLTSNLERRLGLVFEFENFLGGGSEVVEVSVDLALREPL